MDFTTVASSVVASASARLVFHPVDTLRTISQTTGGTYRIPVNRLWSGLLPGIGFTVPGFTAYLVAYRQSKAMLTPYCGSSSIQNYILSGSIAEIASSFVWTPTEVLKGRMQIASKSLNTFQLMKQVYLQEGLKGFFHGYFMGLVVFLPHSVVWWVTYESLLDKWKQSKQSEMQPYNYAVCAASATSSAVVCTNFLDVIKTRQQLSHSPEVAKLRPTDKDGLKSIVKNLVSEKGLLRAFVRGMPLRLMSTVPSSALAMAIMETLHPDPTATIVQEE